MISKPMSQSTGIPTFDFIARHVSHAFATRFRIGTTFSAGLLIPPM